MSTPHDPDALVTLGLAQREFDAAIRMFTDALALRPDHAAAHNGMGLTLFAQGNIALAEHHFRRAIFFQHDFADALMNLAKLCYAQERWEEAATLMERGLSFKPPDAVAFAALARLYYHRLGKFDKALHCFRQCLGLDPDNADYRFHVEALSGSATLTRVPAEVVTNEYDADAERWDQLVRQRGYESPRLLMSALEPAPPPHSLDILDLGCGTGLCGLAFHDWARSLIGIDLSAPMLEQARARGIYDELIHADILSATRAFTARFDLAVASDVLLLLGDLDSLWRAVHQSLRPGGRFAFTVDLHDGPEDYFLKPWSVFAHSQSYLHKLATDIGWQVAAMQDVQHPRENNSFVPGLVVVLAKPI